MKTTIRILAITFLFLTTSTTQAQFFKKLKKKVAQAVENSIVNKADDAVNDVIGKKENEKRERENPETPSISEHKTTTTRNKRGSTPKITEREIKTTDTKTALSTLSIPAFNEDFEPITLLSYKGLPLLGEPDENLIGHTVGKEYEKFNGLLKIKFYRPLFDAMDKEVWYPNRYASEIRYPKEEVNSVIAQKALFAAATSLTSLHACEVYFNKPGERSRCFGKQKIWGGYNASDIRQNTFYKKYVTEQLGNLQHYAQKTPTTAYVVDKMGLKTYDFDRNGFLLELDAASPNVKYTKRNFGAYAPRHGYENVFKTKRRRSFEHLFKIKPEKVEQLFEGKTRYGRTAYFVHKIEWYGADYTPEFKEYLKDRQLKTVRKNNAFNRLQYSYADPVITIYLDPGLTQKIGEINLAEIDQGALHNEISKKTMIHNQPKVDYGNAIPLNGVEEKPKISACTDSKDRRCVEKYLDEWLQEKITNERLKNWFSQYRSENGFRFIAFFVLDISGRMHLKKMRPFSEEALNGIQAIMDANTLKMEPATQREKPVNVFFRFQTIINYNIRKF